MECRENVLLTDAKYIVDDYLWSRAIKIKKNCPNLLKHLPEPVDAVYKFINCILYKC